MQGGGAWSRIRVEFIFGNRLMRGAQIRTCMYLVTHGIKYQYISCRHNITECSTRNTIATLVDGTYSSVTSCCYRFI